MSDISPSRRRGTIVQSNRLIADVNTITPKSHNLIQSFDNELHELTEQTNNLLKLVEELPRS